MLLNEIVPSPIVLDAILISDSPQITDFQLLNEGQWIRGRFDRNLRIDQPTHLAGDGQTHAHVYGRKNDQLGVVNLDGTGSHGTMMKLHPKDADALRIRGFKIRDDNLVEWIMRVAMPNYQILLG